MPAQTFAYLRVFKLGQYLEKNKLDILKLAHEQRLGHVEFVQEKISGKISWRKRQIAIILEQTQEGDMIIVSKGYHWAVPKASAKVNWMPIRRKLQHSSRMGPPRPGSRRNMEQHAAILVTG